MPEEFFSGNIVSIRKIVNQINYQTINSLKTKMQKKYFSIKTFIDEFQKFGHLVTKRKTALISIQRMNAYYSKL